jgi:hypothetical protein
MASVYLPFGYPELSGEEFDILVYQGTLCRYYPDVTDPRTSAQLFERQINSDMAKTRATLGWWGKKSLRAALGQKWTTVLFQAIKADIEGWWTGALEEWDDLLTGEKAAWREINPYTPCFNDTGKVIYALQRTMYQAMGYFAGPTWEMDEWLGPDSEDCEAWWTLGGWPAYRKGQYEENTWLPDGSPGWTWYADASCSGGHYNRGWGGLSYPMEVYFYGRQIQLIYLKNTYGGNVVVEIDGDQVETFSMANATPVYGLTKQYILDFLGLHYFKVYATSSSCLVDRIDVY